MGKVIVVGIFLGVVLYLFLRYVASLFIEYGKKLGRKEVKKNEK